MQTFQTSLLVSVALVAGAPARAPLSIHVAPAALEVRGDTVRVAYVVTNAPASTAGLFTFTVDALAPALVVERPSRTLQWHVTRSMAGRNVASWSFIETELAPGRTSPPLRYTAIGLPGLVRYWGIVYTPPDSVESADAANPPAATGPGALANDSGMTVGIVPFPADRSRAALLVRLARLTTQACALGWIDNAGVCNSLQAKIRDGNDRALANELEAQRDKHVNASAYFLLMGNIRALPVS